MIDRLVGQRLSQEVAQQAGPGPVPGAVAVLLANPIEIKSTVHNALPDGTGNGLSAFYYSLLLLLAGFTGSIVVSMLVDSMLGFVRRIRPGLPVRRAGEDLAIPHAADQMGVDGDTGIADVSRLYLDRHEVGYAGPEQLGVVALRGIRHHRGRYHIHVADRGTGRIGLLVSMFVFVILGLPSAGATVPLQGRTGVLRLAGEVRADAPGLLGRTGFAVLDGRADAGLSQSLELTAIGLVIGLLLGGIVTRIYDRRGYHRFRRGSWPPPRARPPLPPGW